MKDLKCCLAALRWLMQSAASSDTDPSILNSELQQLGLPIEHSDILKDTYGQHKNNIIKALKENPVKGNNWFVSIQCEYNYCIGLLQYQDLFASSVILGRS